jgi:hypothetical protein
VRELAIDSVVMGGLVLFCAAAISDAVTGSGHWLSALLMALAAGVVIGVTVLTVMT